MGSSHASAVVNRPWRRSNLVLFVAVAFFVTGVVAAAGSKYRAYQAPSLWIDQIGHDLGAQGAGSTLVHEILVQNRGRTPLALTRIQTDCLCSVVDSPEQPIGAGESASLPVRVRVPEAEGSFSTTILIVSNDPKQPHQRVVLHGEVRPAGQLTGSAAITR